MIAALTALVSVSQGWLAVDSPVPAYWFADQSSANLWQLYSVDEAGRRNQIVHPILEDNRSGPFLGIFGRDPLSLRVSTSKGVLAIQYLTTIQEAKERIILLDDPIPDDEVPRISWEEYGLVLYDKGGVAKLISLKDLCARFPNEALATPYTASQMTHASWSPDRQRIAFCLVPNAQVVGDTMRTFVYNIVTKSVELVGKGYRADWLSNTTLGMSIEYQELPRSMRDRSQLPVTGGVHVFDFGLRQSKLIIGRALVGVSSDCSRALYVENDPGLEPFQHHQVLTLRAVGSDKGIIAPQIYHSDQHSWHLEGYQYLFIVR